MVNTKIEKYTILKIRLDKIVNNDQYLVKINDVVNRTHQLVIHVYQFIHLWILYKYKNKLDIPMINENTIKMAFRALSDQSFGPKPKGDNLDIYEEFETFYKNTYSELEYSNKISSLNLSSIIQYQCVDMLTNIENNIKLHFINYVKRFINGSFKDKHNTILESYKGVEKAEMKKQLNRNLEKVKNDILNGPVGLWQVHANAAGCRR